MAGFTDLAVAWEIVNADGDTEVFGQTETYEDVWEQAVDWLIDNRLISMASLNDDEYLAVTTTYVNPVPGIQVRDWTIITGPA